MVNYRRVCVAFILTLSTVSSAPASDEHRVVYDQRQNGTENYRLNIDGVVIAVAPAESFLSALSDIDFSDLIDLESLEQELKPKPPASLDLTVPKPDDKPVQDSKPEGKPEEKPELKPQDEKPEAPSKLDDVAVEPSVNIKSQKKSAQLKRQETTQRLKHRIASIFLPFLRKRRHQ